MTTMQEVEFAYQVGEEVVFDLPAPAVPDAAGAAAGWSIGEIIHRASDDAEPAYTISYRDGDRTHTARVSQSAIEGTA